MRLSLIERLKEKKNGCYLGMFQCSCGSVKKLNISMVKNGYIKSCGCLSREFSSSHFKELNKLKRKHGCSSTNKQPASPEYNTWCSMKKRCYVKTTASYKHYGGRGISVCQRWLDSFESFLEDMGPRPSSNHSIDRINVNGNYEPENCRWATAIEQRHNQRPKKNEIFFKEEGTVEASKRLGGWKGMVYDRIRKGWSTEKAFSTPAHFRRKDENKCA